MNPEEFSHDLLNINKTHSDSTSHCLINNTTLVIRVQVIKGIPTIDLKLTKLDLPIKSIN